MRPRKIQVLAEATQLENIRGAIQAPPSRAQNTYYFVDWPLVMGKAVLPIGK